MRVGLLKRASREFVRNVAWMLALYAALAALLVLGSTVSTAWVLAGCVVVFAVAALVTVLSVWGGAHSEGLNPEGHRGHHGALHPEGHRGLGVGGGWHDHGGSDGGGWDGGGGDGGGL